MSKNASRSADKPKGEITPPQLQELMTAAGCPTAYKLAQRMTTELGEKRETRTYQRYLKGERAIPAELGWILRQMANDPN